MHRQPDCAFLAADVSRTRKTRDALIETCLKGILKLTAKMKTKQIAFFEMLEIETAVFCKIHQEYVFKDWYDGRY